MSSQSRTDPGAWPDNRMRTPMIHSMTAFASTEHSGEFGRLRWEIRSVNHRYLDVAPKLPEDFRGFEGRIRERVGERLSRGRVELLLRFEPEPGVNAGSVQLDDQRAAELLAVFRRLADLGDSEQPPPLTTVLGWPGVVVESPPDLSHVGEAAMELLDRALDDLLAARRREGEKLAAVISQRVAAIGEWTDRIREWLPAIREGVRDRIQERCAELKSELDPGRLEQEVALAAQKLDVDEELDRLAAHVDEARRVLELEEPVGRRLDFLLQEFHREANTLASKSVDQRTSQAGVELKVLIEQIREQVQNVE